MKYCPRCKQTKPDSEFHRRKYPSGKLGLIWCCGKCKTAKVLEHEKRTHYDREYKKEYFQTARGKAALARASKRALQKYPEKWAARLAVRRALAKGILTKHPCQKCSDPKVQAHHPDYSRPLFVQWLCARHHRELHNKYGIAA